MKELFDQVADEVITDEDYYPLPEAEIWKELGESMISDDGINRSLEMLKEYLHEKFS